MKQFLGVGGFGRITESTEKLSVKSNNYSTGIPSDRNYLKGSFSNPKKSVAL